jgi:steroid 5-alpha reductase family enzyme
MAESKTRSVLGTAVAVALGAAMAWAGSQGGATIGGAPVFALCVGIAFAIQWAAFVPSYLFATERFYDITGSFTYVSVMTFAVLASRATDARSLLLLALVIVWAGRLGPFLFRRVLKAGKDDRFDSIKRSAAALFMTWTLQGLWVSLTLAAALGAVTAPSPGGLDAFAYVGSVIWLAGFALEAAADQQKSRFRSDPANRGRFISSGLWAWSRHPNYFGEITLWLGVAVIALPALEGWRLAGLISPAFVYLLITRVSGVPLLEKKADEKWGGEPSYEEYKRSTPVLVPRPPRRHGGRAQGA